MQLNASVNPSLPKLAWVAAVDRTKEVVTLRHGSGVEVRSTFFIEGVWNGPFEDGAFSETDCVFGTGGILSEESIRFVTSACTTDYVFYADTPGQVTVSNSLPLLLGAIGDALDPRYLEYPDICDSIMDGINRYRREIPTQRGTVRRQMYRNLDVSREKIVETDKRLPPRFRSFTEYRSYLQENYARIAANARARQRTQPLEIWSTQSKGYDTTAVNAIAGAMVSTRSLPSPKPSKSVYWPIKTKASCRTTMGERFARRSGCRAFGSTGARLPRSSTKSISTIAGCITIRMPI